MGMPEASAEQITPGLPKGAVEQVELPKNEKDNRNSSMLGAPQSLVEVKKEIIHTEDEAHQLQLSQYLKFRTSSQKMSSFREYVDRMADGQTCIYYMIGRNVQQLSRSPFVRRFVDAGLEVIYMTDTILDDQVVKKLGKQFDRFRLVSVHSESLEVPELINNKTDRRKRHREALDEFLPLCKRLRTVYPHQIEKIVISKTLVESSCAMVPRDVDVDETEPSFEVNKNWGSVRLEINPESDSLRLLLLQARLLEKKQEHFDDLVQFLFGPPTAVESVEIVDPCSPTSDGSCSTFDLSDD